VILAACLDIRPGRKASDDLLSVPTTWVGHPILRSRCGESQQARGEARPISVAALSLGPVPLASGSHQVAPSPRLAQDGRSIPPVASVLMICSQWPSPCREYTSSMTSSVIGRGRADELPGARELGVA
jgi:hypothetical protein